MKVGDNVLVVRGPHPAKVGMVVQVMPRVSFREHETMLVQFSERETDKAWIPADHLRMEDFAS